jgi:hypothetical protein
MDVVKVYVDPILYVLAAITVVMAVRSVEVPVEDQHPDFTIFWDNLRWNAAGHDLYTSPHRWAGQDTNFAPPALLLLVAPLASMPLDVARAAWILLAVGLYALSAYWVARALQLPAGRTFAILMISRATHVAIIGGTFAAPLTLCITRAWLDDRQQRETAAGFWAGVAIAWKPFLLPLVGYAVVRRRWRMCAGIAYGLAAVFAVGIIAFGVSNTVLWLRGLSGAGVPTLVYPLNGSWMAWLGRSESTWSKVRVWWLTGGMLIGVALLWRWWRRDADVDVEWLGTLCGSLLVSPLGWVYYAPMLLGPFAGARSPLLWVGYGLCSLPLEWVGPAALGSPALALTLGSAYFFGFLALFVSSVAANVRERRP